MNDENKGKIRTRKTDAQAVFFMGFPVEDGKKKLKILEGGDLEIFEDSEGRAWAGLSVRMSVKERGLTFPTLDEKQYKMDSKDDPFKWVSPSFVGYVLFFGGTEGEI